MRARLALFAAATAALCIVAAACSVVDDGKVNRIDPPDELVDTLPSTSTSTTVLETTTTGEETTTSILQTELVRLYFITSGQLTYVNQSLPSPVALPLIIFALQQGPPTGEIGTGLRTAIPRDVQITVRTDDSGVASVDLPDGFFDNVAVGDQRLVIAQIVLTLTNSKGVGQVRFDQPVPNALGELAPAGELLAARDYISLTGTTPSPTESAGGPTTSASSTSTSAG